MNSEGLQPVTTVVAAPAIVAASGEKADMRFLEFFAANIPQPAHAPALQWRCGGVPGLVRRQPGVLDNDVQPLHVAAWIETQQQERAAPTVKLRLAAIRYLFDWLVIGQVVPVNPARSVRGPSHVVTAAKTPVLAGVLIGSIEVPHLSTLNRAANYAARCLTRGFATFSRWHRLHWVRDPGRQGASFPDSGRARHMRFRLPTRSPIPAHPSNRR